MKMLKEVEEYWTRRAESYSDVVCHELNHSNEKSWMDVILKEIPEDKKIKIAVAGTGYVGMSIATLLAQHHQVTAVDVIPEKVEKINHQVSPIQDEYIEKYLAERKDNPYLFYNSRGNPLNTMYISRMMKKYSKKAGIPSYSAQSIRNSCGCTLFAYEASSEQVARQMGTTRIQIKRYQNISYKEALQREAGRLVKLKIEPP